MGNYETRMRLISETNVNVANNTSYVTVAFDFRRTDYSYYGYNLTGDAYWNIKVGTQSTGNVKFTYNWSFGQNVWKEVARRSFTVTHNADGKKSINMSGTLYFGAGVSPGTLTASDSAALTTIPRATTPTLSPASQAVGSAITINLPRASSAFTHKLTYKFGSASGTIATAAGALQSWTLPASLAAQIPNETSGAGTITCETYNGSTLVGTKSIGFTATVPSSMVPSIGTVSISEAVAGLSAQFGAYVQNKSKLKISISANGVQGSSITSYKTEVDGNAYTGSSITTGLLTSAGSLPIKVTVTDSRGRTASKTQNVNVVVYTNPSIVTFSAVRCNPSGTFDEQGTSMSIAMNFNVADVGSKNTKSYIVELLKNGSTTWTKVVNGSVYSYNSTYIADNAVSVDSSYTLRLKVTDYFTTSTATVNISSGFTLMDFRATGKGIGIGKVSEKDQLEVNIIAEFYKALILHGNGSQYNLFDKISELSTQISNNASQISKHTSQIAGKEDATNGHVKLINTLTSSSYSVGEALSAYQGYLLNNKIENKKTKKLTTLVYVTADKKSVGTYNVDSDAICYLVKGYCNNISSGFYSAIIPNGGHINVPIFNTNSIIYNVDFQHSGTQIKFKAQYSGNTSLRIYIDTVIEIYL